MAKNFTALVTALLADNSIQNAIDAQAKKARLTIPNVEITNIDKFAKSVQDALNKAKFNIDATDVAKRFGHSIGESVKKEVESSLNKIGLTNGGLNHVKDILQNSGFDKKSIEAATQELNKMLVTVEKIKTTQLANGNIKMNITGVDQLGRAVSILREFNKETGEISTSSKSFTQTYAANVKNAARAIQEAKTAFSQLKAKQEEIKKFEVKLSGIDKASEQANLLRNKLNEAYESYNRMFSENSGKLSNLQLESLAEGFRNIALQSDLARTAMEDAAKAAQQKSDIKAAKDAEAAAFENATRRITEYFQALANLEKNEAARKDVHYVDGQTGYISSSGKYQQLAQELTRVRAAYEEVSSAEERSKLSVENQAKVMEFAQQKAREYGLTVEEYANRRARAEDEAAARAQKQAEKAKNAQDNKAVNDALSSLISKQKQIADLQKELNKLGSDSNRVDALRNQISKLSAEFDKLYLSYAGKFSDSQLSKLFDEINSSGFKITDANNKLLDTERLKEQARAAKETSAAYSDMMKLAEQIGKKKIEIAKLDPNTDSAKIAELKTQLHELIEEFDKLSASSKTDGFTGEQFTQLAAKVREADKEIEVIEAHSRDLARNLGESLKNGVAGNNLDDTINKFEKLKSVTPELANQMKELKAAAETLKSDTASDREKIAAYETYNRVLKDTTDAVNRQYKAEHDAAKASEKLTQEKNRAAKMMADLDTWLSRNPKVAQAFGAELENIRDQLRNVETNGANLNTVSTQIAKLKAEAKAAGLVTDSWAASFKKLGLQILGLGSTYQIIMKIINAVKQGVNTVVELDTALVDLRKTTTMSDNELSSFYRDANEEAKRLGTTTQQLIQSAADWSRLGYSSKTDATRMAGLAAQFSAISPGMDVNQATTGLVSIMKAYGIETEEVLDGVMSKINRVGNTAATNNAEIVTGLQNSASALAAMNTDLSKSIALFTAGQEISQDASKVGMIIAQTYSNVWCGFIAA